MVGRTSHIFARVNLWVQIVHPRPALGIKLSDRVSTPSQDQDPSPRPKLRDLVSPVIISMGSALRKINDISINLTSNLVD